VAQFSWSSDQGDCDNFLLRSLLGCDAARTKGSNVANFCYPPFEELVVKAKSVNDCAERTQPYREVQVIFKRAGAVVHDRPCGAIEAATQGSKDVL
jgi:dipeptide transport system substrate-binding protein